MRKLAIGSFVVFLCLTGLSAEDIFNKFYFRENYSLSKKTRVAVLNFECDPGWSSKADVNYLKTIEKKNIEKMEIVLLESGLTLIERNKLEKLLEEKNMSLLGLTELKYQEIGSFLNADIVVFGLIPSWTFYQNKKTGTIEIIIKAIDVNTGNIVLKAIYNHQFKTENDTFRYDISKIEDKIYFDLLEKELKRRIKN